MEPAYLKEKIKRLSDLLLSEQIRADKASLLAFELGRSLEDAKESNARLIIELQEKSKELRALEKEFKYKITGRLQKTIVIFEGSAVILKLTGDIGHER